MDDPFGHDECVYTFENRCKEIPDLSLKDESTKIFLNASGNKENLPEELKDFLEFLSGKEPKGKLATEIAKQVDRAVKHEEWRTDYMTLLQRDREKFAAGKAEGRAEGAFEALAQLVHQKLLDIKDAAAQLNMTPEEFQEKMLSK